MARKKLLKVTVYDDGSVKMRGDGVREPVEVNAADMDEHKTTQKSGDSRVPVFHANPYWVYIAGRWIRIG